MHLILRVLFLAVFCVLVVLVLGYLSFQRRIAWEIRDLFAKANKEEGQVVTADMLRGLPEPVQRYLTSSGVVGKPLVKTVRLKQTGKIRQSPRQQWMDIDAHEYYTVDPPGFIWIGRMRVAGLPAVTARDMYTNGTGNMLIKMGYVYTLGDARGPEMDQGSMMRYLQEATWFPSAFLGQNITWKAIDDTSAEVTFTNSGKSVTATMCFDAKGKMTNFVAQRYRTVREGYELETWSTPMTEYGEFEGLKLPIRGQGVWNLASGDFAYIDVQATDIEYDNPEPY